MRQFPPAPVTLRVCALALALPLPLAVLEGCNKNDRQAAHAPSDTPPVGVSKESASHPNGTPIDTTSSTDGSGATTPNSPYAAPTAPVSSSPPPK